MAKKKKETKGIINQWGRTTYLVGSVGKSEPCAVAAEQILCGLMN